MSYVKYNQALYRTGFRPYGHTDAFAASQLNGLSGGDDSLAGADDGMGQVHPFGPWALHGYDDGLGQSHPFTRSGGWPLHGLGVLVPDQAILTYRGKWNPGRTPGGRTAIELVSSALAADGLKVTNSSWDSTAYGSMVGKAFDVTLQILVQTGRGGFGDPSDVAAIVDHEVWVATGAMPLASSVPTVQQPGGAGPSDTGQPAGPGGDPAFQPPPDGSSSSILPWLALGIVGLALLPKVFGR
jgi:hypothetical protein